MGKINKAILLQNKGAVTGAAWAELSMIGYAILYPQLGGYHASILYQLLFLFISILDKIESVINPNFSFSYTLVYTYRANALLFIIILGIGGLVGGVIGTGAEYTIKNTADYVSEHQEPAIKKVKENTERIIKKAREQIQKYQKKKGE